VRIVWVLTIETAARPATPEARGPILRWAVVGLAVLGVSAIILFRLATR
jgi:hypothetical protein